MGTGALTIDCYEGMTVAIDVTYDTDAGAVTFNLRFRQMVTFSVIVCY